MVPGMGKNQHILVFFKLSDHNKRVAKIDIESFSGLMGKLTKQQTLIGRSLEKISQRI